MKELSFDSLEDLVLDYKKAELSEIDLGANIITTQFTLSKDVVSAYVASVQHRFNLPQIQAYITSLTTAVGEFDELAKDEYTALQQEIYGSIVSEIQAFIDAIPTANLPQGLSCQLAFNPITISDSIDSLLQDLLLSIN